MDDKIKIIIEGSISDETDLSNEWFYVKDSKLNKDSKLDYTLSFETFKLILNNMTIRATCLDNNHLNDAEEKEYKGLEIFSKEYFITCFSNTSNDNVYFWKEYGGKNIENKIILRFYNFFENIQDVLMTDFILTDNHSKIWFGYKLLRRSYYNPELFSGSIIDNFVRSIRSTDVLYGPKDLSYDQISDIKSKNGGILLRNIETKDLSEMATKKDDSWSKENESRVITKLEKNDQNYSFIDLRLKENLFKNLKIILNPNADENFLEIIENELKTSNLDNKIIQSIIIESSCISKIEEVL